MQLYASTSAHKLNIPSTSSHPIVWTHVNTAACTHWQVRVVLLALGAAAAFPRQGYPNVLSWEKWSVKKINTKQDKNTHTCLIRPTENAGKSDSPAGAPVCPWCERPPEKHCKPLIDDLWEAEMACLPCWWQGQCLPSVEARDSLELPFSVCVSLSHFNPEQ